MVERHSFTRNVHELKGARAIVFVVIKCIALHSCHHELDARFAGALVGVVAHLVAFIALGGFNRGRFLTDFLFFIANWRGVVTLSLQLLSLRP